MSYDLWLDDYRRRPVSGGMEIEWALSMCDFIRIIEARGLPRLISFDHDLSEAHYAADYSDGQTGYDCAVWLADYCRKKGLGFPMWRVHSMNFSRAELIKSFLLRYAGDKYNVSIDFGAP